MPRRACRAAQEGGATLITATDWKANATYTQTFINLTAFNPLLADALDAGVHAPLATDYVVRHGSLTAAEVPKSTLAQALEPEFITFSSDSTKAYIVCQEANTIAVLDLTADPPAFTELRPLGWKDLSLAVNQLDPSDRVRARAAATDRARPRATRREKAGSAPSPAAHPFWMMCRARARAPLPRGVLALAGRTGSRR